MINLQRIIIHNYKSIKKVSFDVMPNSVFIGKNNNGKSSLLEAIELAFTYSNIDKEEVFESIEDPFCLDKKVFVDIKIVPVDEVGNISSNFNDEWGLNFGDKIQTSPDSKEYFAFRTTLEYDDNRQIYMNQKNLIIEWNDEGEHRVGSQLSRAILNPFDVFYVSAQRDLSIDIKDKKSLWYKLTSNISIDDEDKEEINSQINILNKKIIENNPILSDVSNNLKVTTASEESEIDVIPITNDINNIYKGMNIYYKTDFNMPISIENLGLGVRNWAVFSVIKAYINAKNAKMKEGEIPYFPILLVEEPESHVHPQAQRHMLKNIREITGQKFITTHSPFVLSQVDIKNIFYVIRKKAKTEVKQLIEKEVATNSQEMQSINRVVMDSHGELFFSDGVILVEGVTDVEAIKIFFKTYFDKEPFEYGLNIVCVNGGNYKPFIKILNILEIKWFIFSDGEETALSNLKALLKQIFNNDIIAEYKNIICIPKKMCLESYLISEGYVEEIKKALNIIENKEDYIKYYIIKYQGQKRSETVFRDYKCENGEIIALQDAMLENKTKYTIEIATQISKKEDKNIPDLIKKLFDLIYPKEEKEGEE